MTRNVSYFPAGSSKQWVKDLSIQTCE